MTLTVDLTPAEEERLADAARRQGLAPDALVKRWLGGLPAPSDTPPLSPTVALFRQWEAEDPVTSEEDQAERQREGDALLVSLRDNPLRLREARLPDDNEAAA